jgi:phospholipid/cholesterol/gamma-HCH transport system permease protein
MAAELGTMVVSEEVDALHAMAIDPAKFLVMPRLVAMALLCPMMTTYASIMGIAGGALLANTQLGVSFEAFRNDALEALTTKDLFTGLFKAFVFGIIIATVACTQGLRASGGAIGVGYATRRAVVISFVLIIISGYYITWFFYR